MTAEKMRDIYFEAMTAASGYTLPSGTEVSGYEEWSRLCAIRDALVKMIEESEIVA